MKRFEDAQIGDLVYCRLYGEGIIKLIRSTSVDFLYPVRVDFKNIDDWRDYTLDGRNSINDVEAVLFYRDDTNNYLEERPTPTPKVPWDKVPVDTKVVVWLSDMIRKNRYFNRYDDSLQRSFFCFDFGSTHWSSDGRYAGWNGCELAEDITIDGILYKAGSK